jgi:pimeloyl-ACP methyl ester carboxylesterase
VRDCHPITQSSDENALRQVQLPVLVVVGGSDPALRSAQLLVETVPHAELVVLPDETHMTALPAQGFKEAVAAFLEKHAFSVV